MKIPQLRFPEFNNKYSLLEVNDFCKVVDCQHSTAPILETPTEYKMIRTSNVRNGKLITKTMNSVSEEIFHKWSIRGYLKKDDVVLTREAPMGEVAIITREDVRYFLGQRVLQLLSNRDVITPQYLLYILQSHTFQKHIRPIKSGGSTVSNIRIPEFKSMKFQIPNLEEQRKVAYFLSLMDSKIEIQQKKINKLELFKKSITQKIFSQEIRFKDDHGQNYSEWVAKRLRDITILITKGTTPSNGKYAKEGINFIKVENISANGFTNPRVKITAEEHNGKLKRSILHEDDLLFSIAGSLGRTAKIKKEHLPANTNQALAIIRFDTNTIDIDFIFHTLRENYIKKYIYKNLSVGAQPNLSLEQVSNININLPEKNEQKKISVVLNLLDKKIYLEENKLNLLKEQKQCFIKQMFI